MKSNYIPCSSKCTAWLVQQVNWHNLTLFLHWILVGMLYSGPEKSTPMNWNGLLWKKKIMIREKGFCLSGPPSIHQHTTSLCIIFLVNCLPWQISVSLPHTIVETRCGHPEQSGMWNNDSCWKELDIWLEKEVRKMTMDPCISIFVNYLGTFSSR